MNIQKSYKDKGDTGILYLVGTPIGNLNDITYRAVETLKEADIIAAEDTRQTIKLLNHLDIQKTLVSYHEHNKETSGRELILKLKGGKTIALVSDAGMPAISDPGYELVQEAVNNNITIVPIPGANAAISGLIASGLPTKRFIFIGFLSRDKKNIKKELLEIKNVKETIICYEAPHRITKTLKAIFEILGNRNIVLVRELTKLHEEFIRGNTDEIITYTEENNIKGELTVIIEGANEDSILKDEELWWKGYSITDHVDYYMKQGLSSKEAIKSVALDRNIPKREIYQEYHKI